MPTSGYQEVLDQSIVYIMIEENCKTNSFSKVEKQCVFQPLTKIHN
jgi:hypothetical protein